MVYRWNSIPPDWTKASEARREHGKQIDGFFIFVLNIFSCFYFNLIAYWFLAYFPCIYVNSASFVDCLTFATTVIYGAHLSSRSLVSLTAIVLWLQSHFTWRRGSRRLLHVLRTFKILAPIAFRVAHILHNVCAVCWRGEWFFDSFFFDIINFWQYLNRSTVHYGASRTIKWS